MVHIEAEFVTQQVMMEFMECIHHCECLPSSHYIILISVVEQLRCIGNHLVTFFGKVLNQHSPNKKIKSICVNMKLDEVKSKLVHPCIVA
jgi:hypothetical protein